MSTLGHEITLFATAIVSRPPNKPSRDPTRPPPSQA
jgi:hypothetical protein